MKEYTDWSHIHYQRCLLENIKDKYLKENEIMIQNTEQESVYNAPYKKKGYLKEELRREYI